MKAVIVDLQGESTAALCEDGTFREVPDKGYSIGQTIEIQVSLADPAEYSEETEKAPGIHVMPPDVSGTLPTVDNTAARTRVSGTVKKNYAMRLRCIGAAAAACFLGLSISAGTVWAIPYGKVYVANGASLSYTINRFDYVLDVNAEDESGKGILDELDMKKIVNRKIDRAVEETIGQMESSAGEEEDVKKAVTESEREIEIIIDIKNERHARTIQNRLEKIASSAVNDTDPANNTVEIPAGRQHEKDASSNLSEEEESKEKRLEEEESKEKRLDKEQTKEKQLEEEQSKEKRLDKEQTKEKQLEEEQSEEKRLEEEQSEEKRLEEEQSEEKRLEKEQSKEKLGEDRNEENRNTENLTAPKKDNIPNNLSEECSSF